MNNQRRKMLSNLIDSIEAIRNRITEPAADLEAIKDGLTEVRDLEEEAYENMPESLQEGERGQDMQAAIENIDSAIDAIESLLSALEEIDFDAVVGSIDDARGQEQ